MAIVKVTGNRFLQRQRGLKAAKKAAKKGAKHALPGPPAKKHPAKKHPAKKHPAEKYPAKKHAAEKHAAEKRSAEKRAGKKSAKHAEGVAGVGESGQQGYLGEIEGNAELLTNAFHHLQRASALISLLEPESGGDLRQLLEHGIVLYRAALSTRAAQGSSGGSTVMECAVGLLKAAEHLAMAGLYSARVEFRERVQPPDTDAVKRHLAALQPRVDQLHEPEREQAKRLHAMARELLRRATEADENDPHLEYELAMAADGLCSALERGV